MKDFAPIPGAHLGTGGNPLSQDPGMEGATILEISKEVRKTATRKLPNGTA